MSSRPGDAAGAGTARVTGAAETAAATMAAVDARVAAVRRGSAVVAYRIADDPTALTRDELEAWMTGAEAEGLTHFDYAVDARDDGAVVVTVSAAPPADSTD